MKRKKLNYQIKRKKNKQNKMWMDSLFIFYIGKAVEELVRF